MKNSFKFDKGSIFLILIFVTLGVTIFFFLQATRTDIIAEAIEEGEPITTAILVVNEDGSLLFSEVFFYHPLTQRGAILDIPVKTGVVISSLDRIDRIGRLFHVKKPDTYLEKVGSLIDVPIPHYLMFTLAEIEAQVDLVGGLDIFNANPLEFPEERIFIPSGSLVLDGAKTVLFLSYLEDAALSIEQTDRWEKFLQSLLKAWGKNQEFLRHPKVYPVFRDRLKTNLGNRALKSLITELARLDSGRIVFQRVLGVERVVDNQILLFRHNEGVLLKETVRQTMKSIATMDLVSEEELAATLQILNGTLTAGLAARTGELYKSFGYDVAEVGNADTFDVEYTLVIDRRGDLARAHRVANVINCSRVKQLMEVSDLQGERALDQTIDVTIILGKDFDGRYCKE